MRSALLLVIVTLVGCGSADQESVGATPDEVVSFQQTGTRTGTGAGTVAGTRARTGTGTGTLTLVEPGGTPVTEEPADPGDPAEPEPPPPPPDDPGGKPKVTCNVAKDANGFFPRGGYVGYVPPTYDGSKPVHLLVGLHGCGDNAQNFATWALAPYDTRKAQEHIAISIGGRDGQCWQDSDETAVLAAIADVSSCFWVHQQEIVMAGYSSGGIVAYHTAMKHSDLFAGLLIENSGFYAEADEASLLSSATKFPIAHIAHQSDGDFPLADVQSDWSRIKNAGFSMQTSVVAGTHSGTSADWNTFLLPKLPAMKR